MCVSRFRDFRSRAARTYALDNGILILFGPHLARDRPEIDFWHTFKAKKGNTLRNVRKPKIARSRKGVTT